LCRLEEKEDPFGWGRCRQEPTCEKGVVVGKRGELLPGEKIRARQNTLSRSERLTKSKDTPPAQTKARGRGRKTNEERKNNFPENTPKIRKTTTKRKGGKREEKEMEGRNGRCVKGENSSNLRSSQGEGLLMDGGQKRPP